jgi:ubiquinone/menaquinone biosynthesis C-methylase UbiE
VEDGIPDFLTGELAYVDDRARFWRTHEPELTRLGLAPDMPGGSGGAELQRAQQRHFDWYSKNEKQSYDEYERLPFWVAADGMAFSRWRGLIRPRSWLLDVGCGPGRATAKLVDLDIDILAFDVSKAMVRLAAERFRGPEVKARTIFMAADAMRFPVRSASLDCVMAYGVLHHVPDPPRVCREIDRVLRPGGQYLGSENGTSVFRGLFEVLQKLRPQWYEEAGPEALFSARKFDESFAGTRMSLTTRSSVFLPPHLLNQLSPRSAASLLGATDRIAGSIPFLRDNGGLILVEGTKSEAKDS